MQRGCRTSLRASGVGRENQDKGPELIGLVGIDGNRNHAMRRVVTVDKGTAYATPVTISTLTPLRLVDCNISNLRTHVNETECPIERAIESQAQSPYSLHMRKVQWVSVVLLGLLLGQCVYAGVILDQQQLFDPAQMAAFGQTDLAQSFQQSYLNVAGAGIKLYSLPLGTGDITIAFYDKLPDEGGTLLANGTAVGIAEGSWADVFWTPVSVVPNTTYYLVFTSSNPSLSIAGALGNPYSRECTPARDTRSFRSLTTLSEPTPITRFPNPPVCC